MTSDFSYQILYAQAILFKILLSLNVYYINQDWKHKPEEICITKVGGSNKSRKIEITNFFVKFMPQVTCIINQNTNPTSLYS